MDATRPLLIHELLPREIMGVIFEEHAKLKWNAPTIDGVVCRIWRKIVLNTPRAWTYLEISNEDPPRIRELHEWLHWSGSAPLHIRFNKGPTVDERTIEQTLYYLLGGYHTRIASLRLLWGDPSFFEARDFPCLRLLEVDRWYSTHSPLRIVRWNSMHKLRSLRLPATKVFPLQWSELTQLETLVLFSTTLPSLHQHSRSLVTLMLDIVSFEDAISSPVFFPSLTYLSLSRVRCLKPYIIAPCLVTYHEGWGNICESFSSPLPSLVEYGVYSPSIVDLDLAKWHHYFPNILRLSIRVAPFLLISFLGSLSRDPHSLPVLQVISAEWFDGPFAKQDRATMESLALIRREKCQTDFVLCFERTLPFQIPLFFGEVSYCLSSDRKSLMHILEPGNPFLNVVGPSLAILSHLAH